METVRRQSGFTLVELLIVAIILAILAAIVIPQFTETTTDARQSAVRAELKTAGHCQAAGLARHIRIPGQLLSERRLGLQCAGTRGAAGAGSTGAGGKCCVFIVLLAIEGDRPAHRREIGP